MYVLYTILCMNQINNNAHKVVVSHLVTIRLNFSALHLI